MENLRNKEVKYFRWYLRTADESKDGFRPIRRCRLKHADRLDILDLLLQMYPAKTKEVTEKILVKISSNTARNWILDLFEELGDKELKYCQMLLQSTDKLKGGIKSMKRIPVEGGEKVDAADLMMQIYSSENREEVEKVLNELKEGTAVGETMMFLVEAMLPVDALRTTEEVAAQVLLLELLETNLKPPELKVPMQTTLLPTLKVVVKLAEHKPRRHQRARL
ncbi:hypothetical protein GOODEAATRI_031657 [Goodea atripinnis]|uniref:Pyrin domain-containing protein n=1 Tax=Goodea atripinnis TaxID=208336 RepID=A0ABV0P2V8_9TELE